MKKLLLVSTALVGVAMMSASASAAVKLDLGGFFRGYGVYADTDEVPGAAFSRYNFEFRRDTEIHVNGETTLDNGLTIGAHTEMKIANGGTGITADETYGYASGGWGRVNLGLEDGAAYLLQVAAPSADSNVDGMRVYIQALAANNAGFANTGLANVNFGSSVLDYAHSDFKATDRLTYLTPKFNGFQAGASYAPKMGVTSNTAAMALDQDGLGLVPAAGGGTAAQYKELWEVAARWDGEFQGLGVSLGAGYSTASIEETPTNAQILALVTQDYYLDDGVNTYNIGASLAYQGFTLGGAFLRSDTSRVAETVAATSTGTGDITRDTWVVGLGYDNGPYHLGGSYLNQETDYDAIGTGLGQAIAATSYEADKFTVGGGYTFGPGMTFRGAVAWGTYDLDPGATSATDNDFTQVTVGTDIQF